MLANGASRSQVAAGIFGSPEYQKHLVDVFYQDFLRRQADAGGESGWTNLLLRGKSESDFPNNEHEFQEEQEHGVADEGLIAGLMGSPEYFNDAQANCPFLPPTPRDFLAVG